jgi:hypothetical protein
MFTDRELATVLAALRQWQRDTPKMLPFEPGDDRTGTHFEDHLPLTVEEIDQLCERINVKQRLEYLRGELQAERISYDELHELQSLAEHIEPDDVELLQAAGVPEFPDDDIATDESRAFGPRSNRKFE